MAAPLARWAAQLTETILTAVRAEVDPLRRTHVGGVVTRIETGQGRGGADLVWVSWQDREYAVDQLDHYTPGVGDVVLLAYHGNQLTIIGRRIGGPRVA